MTKAEREAYLSGKADSLYASHIRAGGTRRGKRVHTLGMPQAMDLARKTWISFIHKQYAQSRQDFIEWLKSIPCQDCHQCFPPECMDFDHRDGESKLGIIATMKTLLIDKLQAEVMKCDLVCSNCHRIRTRKRMNKFRRRTMSIVSPTA